MVEENGRGSRSPGNGARAQKTLGGRASVVRSSVDSWVVEEESDINEAPRQRAMLMPDC